MNVVNYASSPRPHHVRRWAPLVCVLALSLAICVVVYYYRAPIIDHYRLVDFQRHLLRSLPPPGQIIHTTYADEAAALSNRPQGAGSYEPVLGPGARDQLMFDLSSVPAVGWVPEEWWQHGRQLLGRGPDYGLLLVQRLHRPDGEPRIICLDYFPSIAYEMNSLPLRATVVKPGTLFSKPRVVWKGAVELRLGWFGSRLYAGHIDPADPSHCLMPFKEERYGRSFGPSDSDGWRTVDGTFHLHLMSDDTIIIRKCDAKTNEDLH